MPFDSEFWKREWPTLKKAPISFIALFSLGFCAGLAISNLYYKHIVELAEERVKFADFANVERMKKHYEKDLDAAIKRADDALKDNTIKFSTDCAWVKPICMSLEDSITVGSARQILLHNESYEAICPEVDKDYCKNLELPYKDERLLWPPNTTKSKKSEKWQ